jgi:hypothetical protein
MSPGYLLAGSHPLLKLAPLEDQVEEELLKYPLP